MKSRSAAMMLVLALIATFASSAAFAHRGHFHPRARIGVFVGAPVFWPGYYPYYYPRPYYWPYYYPPAVVVPSSPPTYVERADEQDEAAAPSSYWHYCADPPGYYPDVRECGQEWQRVPPRPPGPSR
jgi:hypothetical protein